ncbi:MAG: TolC family protein [Polyangiaceae bacterium]|nr:TolC family protein [Polyangiaceae bacterium]MCW5790964.1 TolC family protein [Polyangiaceae bacterium]
MGLTVSTASAAPGAASDGSDRGEPYVPNAAERLSSPGKASSARTYSLARCLELADRNYPKVASATAKLKKYEAQLAEARTAPFSQWSARGGFALAPTVRGSSIYSPNTDVSLSDDMGLAWQIGIEGVIPLWTFGKITSLWDAAEAQVDVGRHEVQKQRGEVRRLVYEAYYGVKLARDSLALVKDAGARIDKYLGQLEKKVARGDGDTIELLKLKMNRAELTARESEAREKSAQALAALRFLTGVSRLDVADTPLEPVGHRLAPLSRYLSAARLFRPEVNMARAGMRARQAQVRLQRAKYFPDVGLGLTARYARAPEVTDQQNPFVSDSANITSYGAALVLRWNLDFLPNLARVAQVEADLEEMRATEQFALGGVALEVENAFTTAREAQRRLEAYSQAAQYAKRWLIEVQQGIDLGTMEEEDIVDPAKEYALKRFSKMSATYAYNMAVVALAVVTGWEAALPTEPEP